MQKIIIALMIFVWPGSTLLGLSKSFNEKGNPPKSTWIKISEKLDKQKPLALTDYSGFIISGESIYGGVDSEWAVKYDLKSKKPNVWFKIDSELSVPMVVSANFVLASTKSGTLYKYDNNSGKLIWKTKIQTYAVKNLILNAGLVLTMDASGSAVGVDLNTGVKKWIAKLSNVSDIDVRDSTSIATKGSLLYIGNRKSVEVFKVKTGDRVGEFATPSVDGKFGAIIGDISFTSNSVVFARYDGYLFSFSLDEMAKIRWKRRLEGEISSLNSKSGTLYVGTTKGDFSLLDIRTGKVIWSKNFGEPISGAHIGLNYLYIHSTGGLVAKVKKSDSKIEWIDDLDARLFSTPFTFDGEIFYSSGAKNIYGYKL